MTVDFALPSPPAGLLLRCHNTTLPGLLAKWYIPTQGTPTSPHATVIHGKMVGRAEMRAQVNY